MLVFVFFTLIIVGMFVRNSRIYDNIVILFLCFIVATNKTHADYWGYALIYQQIGLSGFKEIIDIYYESIGAGWYYLCLLGNSLGLTYNGFVATLLFVCMKMISSVIYKYVEEHAMSSRVFAYYLIFPGLIDLVQFRNFVALSIVIYILPIMAEKKKHWVIYSIIGLFIASYIHYTVISYAMFFFASYFRRYKKSLFIIVSAVSIYFIIFYDIIPPLVSWFVKDSVRINAFLSSWVGLSRYVLICLFFYVSNYILVNMASNNIKHNLSCTANALITTNKSVIFSEFILGCNIVMIATFPLVFFRGDFIRIPRGLWIVTSIVYMIDLACSKSIKDRVLKGFLYFLYYAAANYCFINISVFEHVTKALLTFDGWTKIFQ